MQITDEIRLIFLWSNPSMSLKQEEDACFLLEKKIDWNELIEKSNSLGVSLIIYKQIKDRFRKKVPPKILDKLHQVFFHTTTKNMVLSKTLIQLLDLFSSNKIQAVPFKGPVLSLELYGNDSLRFSNDLDILIRTEDITKAKKLMLSTGFFITSKIPEPYDKKYYQIDHALEFFHAGLKVHVDLQWKLFRIYTPESITLEKLSRRLRQIDFFDTKINCLGIEDLLFFLCTHGTKHLWKRLEYVTSISELIKKNHKIDWEYLLGAADRQGCRRMVLLGLFLSNQIYAATLPLKILSNIEKDKQIDDLAQKIINFYQTGEPICSGFTDNIDLSFFQLIVRDSLKARIIFLWRALTRPSFKEFNSIRLPFICYYIYKPLRLFYKLGMFLCLKFVKRIW